MVMLMIVDLAMAGVCRILLFAEAKYFYKDNGIVYKKTFFQDAGEKCLRAG